MKSNVVAIHNYVGWTEFGYAAFYVIEHILNDVFDEFCRQIDVALTEVDVVYADATHLSQKARNKVLDKLHLDGVDIYPVVFNIPLDTILEQNEQRKGIGRTYVPRSVIRRMYYQFEKPTDNEKYKYKSILTIVRKD